MRTNILKLLSLLGVISLVLSACANQPGTIDTPDEKEPEILDIEVMPVDQAAPLDDADWWQKINGARMYYLQLGLGHTFSANLDNLYNKGYRIISFYAVYDGVENAYAGLGPVNFYNPEPDAGTMDEFESLVAAVDARGMKILSWINLAYSTEDHPYWIKAQEDVRVGIDSKEALSFRWSETDLGPASGESDPEWVDLFGWGYSEIAGMYYKKSWGYAAFDWSSPEWQAEAQAILEFWHEKGIDGWVFDAAEFNEWENYATPEIMKTFVGDIATKDNVIIMAEGSPTDPAWAQARNYLFTYDNTDPEEGSVSHDWENIATLAIEAKNPSGIEPHLTSQSDVAKVNGGGTFAYDPEQPHLEDTLRPLEVALMTSTGVLYELWFSRDWTGTDYGATTEHIEDVLKAVNSTAALEPGGTRMVLPVNHEAVYAFTKTSMDGTEKALCIFNFSPDPSTVAVNLSGAGIHTEEYPLNLVTGGTSFYISSNTYNTTLVGYGFLLLGVNLGNTEKIEGKPIFIPVVDHSSKVAPASETGNWVRLEEWDPTLTFDGGDEWEEEGNSEDVTYSLWTAGDTLTFMFEGTRARLYGLKADYMVTANIMIDDELVAEGVSAFAEEPEYQALIWESEILEEGLHTLVLISNGDTVEIDFIEYK